MPTIELNEVSVQYPNAAPLRDLSVTFRSGSVGILGPSGSGKSTLLRVIAGLQKPTVGVVRIDEQPVAMPSWRSASDRRVAMIHQDYRLVPFLTVAQNLLLTGEARGGERHELDLTTPSTASDSPRRCWTDCRGRCPAVNNNASRSRAA